jgi:hypothetical protein
MLVGDSLRPEYVEAAPDAKWARVDPFRYYKPLVNRSEADPIHPPHKPFAKMSDLARDQSAPRRRTRQGRKQLYKGIEVFAHYYGFMGFFREAFASPTLPEQAEPLLNWVAPDALIDDRTGELRIIDPKREGTRLLEKLLDQRYGPFGSGRGVELKRKDLTWPDELRFPRLGLDYGEFGLQKPSFGDRHSNACPYEEVQERFGIRFVLDEHAREGVSIIATREPLDFWLAELKSFRPAPPGPAYFDQTLEGVSPRAVANEEGSLDPSWRCPSLLKAVYLMLYLDETAGTRLLKCQAPGCPEYYRVGPRGRESFYCPPPPGRKESRCTSRVTSQRYRERQRRKTGTN